MTNKLKTQLAPIPPSQNKIPTVSLIKSNIEPIFEAEDPSSSDQQLLFLEDLNKDDLNDLLGDLSYRCEDVMLSEGEKHS